VRSTGKTQFDCPARRAQRSRRSQNADPRWHSVDNPVLPTTFRGSEKAKSEGDSRILGQPVEGSAMAIMCETFCSSVFPSIIR